jgi:hypothetical protein
MLKYLVAIVVVFGMAFVVARQDQHAADQSAQKSAQHHEVAVATNPNEDHSQENIENPTGDGPRWYVLYLYSLFRWPNGTTTLAIVLTLLAIAEQAKETAASTKAMRDSTELQRAGMRQWIQIAKLHGGAQESEWEDGTSRVIFYFDVWNPTDRILKLTRLKMEIGGAKDDLTLSDVIPPNGAYPALIDHKLIGDDLVAYKDGKPRKLSITGEITFIDHLEREQTQPFNVWFHYLMGMGVFMERYYSTAAWVLTETLRAKQNNKQS